MPSEKIQMDFGPAKVFINDVEYQVASAKLTIERALIEVTSFGDQVPKYTKGPQQAKIELSTILHQNQQIYGSMLPTTAGIMPAKEKNKMAPKKDTVAVAANIKTFAEFRPAAVRPHNLPNLMVFHGPEGIGKTSFAAQAPSPFFILAQGETGLLKLMDNARVPDTPYTEVESWDDLISTLEGLLKLEHSYRTLVLDAIGGLERLLHEKVCHEQFNDEWGERGFYAWGRGPKVAAPKFREMLMLLDQLKRQRRMGVIVLAHTAVRSFNNPTGDNYDRYAVDLGIESWAQLHKAADLVLFANHVTVTKEKKGGVQGVGDARQRVIYTERAAAHDAKNRHGLPEMISMGDTAAKGWAQLLKALKAARPTAAPGTPPVDADTAKVAATDDENAPPAGVSAARLAGLDVPGNLATGDGGLTLDEAEALSDKEDAEAEDAKAVATA